MKIIAHLSDLHLGTAIPEVAEGLLDDLRLAQPHLVVVSGDLTQRARTWQFLEARKFLNRIPFPRLVVPGNHDLPFFQFHQRLLRPLAKYQRYISRDLSPVYQDEKIAVLGINTARVIGLINGRIAFSQMRLIHANLSRLSPRLFRVLVTHHPFLPPPRKNRVALVGRAEKMLKLLENCRLDLLLAGHLHMSFAGGTHAIYKTVKGSTLGIQAGTAISRRMRKESNAYNLIEIGRDSVQMTVRMWDGGKFAQHRREVFRKKEGLWRMTGPAEPVAVERFRLDGLQAVPTKK